MRWTASDDAGFTLVEVLVSALILVLLSMAVLGALDATTRSSFSDRLHANAEALAQQNENRLRGLNVDELSNLNKTFQGPKLDGVQFTLQETAQYVSDSSGAVSCTNPSADYLEATTTVTWPNMAGRKPVSVTSVLTPTVGSVDSTNGALAVSVLNAAGTGYGGVNVSIAGATNATATTTASGCALFGDLPSGAYTVTVAPPTGTYVDSLTGATISAATPDTRTVSVAAGSVPTSAPFSLDQAGWISATFSTTWPGSGTAAPTGTGTGPIVAPATPTAPALIAFNTNMNAPSYRMCTPADASACPVVGSQDQAFPASDWAAGGITATPMFPFKSSYSVYAGVCPSDDPNVISGVQDPTATVTPAGSANVSLALPAMVVRLYSGSTVSNASEIKLPANTKLTVSDDGCNVDYISGLTTPAAGQANLPINTTYTPGSTVSNTGLLKYPGMPYGHYTVCYTDAGNKIYSKSVTNSGSGAIVNLLAGSTVTGSC